MKTEVVRARIETELKAAAAGVLAENGLDMSDAIRLFLRQVVRAGGLPFAVNSGGGREVPGETLWQLKRASQDRDRSLIARGKLGAKDLMLIQPEALRGAHIRWPPVKLSD